jgi:hypothetical protein
LRSGDIKADGCDGFHRRRTSSEVKPMGTGGFTLKVGARTLLAGGEAGRWRGTCSWRAGRCRRTELAGSGAAGTGAPPAGFGGGGR